jgi:L-ascorbate metabolism protein UlaG (beta-lactamase superfamily)
LRFALLVTLPTFAAPMSGCFGAPQYLGPTSDHFDGEKFRNLAPFEERSFYDALRWIFGDDPSQKWPDWVDIRRWPAPPARVTDGLRVTFVNHATVLVQTSGMNVLTDPVWSDSVGPFSWLGTKRHKAPGVAFDDLPKIDVVLISHNHYDHLDIPTLQRLAKRDKPLVLAGLGTRALLAEYDVGPAEDLDWWQSRDVGKVRITFGPAQHWSTRGFGDRNYNLWGSFFIQGEGQSVCFAGDTGNGPHFAEIRERLGKPTVALLPIGAYEPRWFMHSQHIDPSEAVAAHRTLGAKRSIGIHFGTFDQSDEGIGAPPHDLDTARREQGVAPAAFLAVENGAALIMPLRSAAVPIPTGAPKPSPKVDEKAKSAAEAPSESSDAL